MKWSNDAAYKSTSKKETLQVIRRVLPYCQDITYSFFFTGAETEIHKIKDNSKIIMQTNLDRRGLRPIPIICHHLDPPSFSLPTTFKPNILGYSDAAQLQRQSADAVTELVLR